MESNTPSAPESIYPPEFREYVREILHQLKCETYHGEYTQTIIWHESPSSDSYDDDVLHASIKIDTVYLSYTVHIWPELSERWQMADYKTIGFDLLHEICHILVEPVVHLFMWDVHRSERQRVQETIERQVCRITNTISDLLPKDWYMPEVIREREQHYENFQKAYAGVSNDSTPGLA